MIYAIRNLMRSRKTMLLLAGVLVAIAARFGLQLDVELVIAILTLFGIAIGGIAYEDGQSKSTGPKIVGPVVGTLVDNGPSTPPAPNESVETVRKDLP